MAKHNYSQYSNKKTNKVETAPEVAVEAQNGVETVVTEEEAIVVNTEPAVETTIEAEPAIETKTGAVAIGKVVKCAKLNVRSKPNTNADAIAILNVDDEVKIDVDKSTDDWFKILTNDGVKGYCMRKFVNANI